MFKFLDPRDYDFRIHRGRNDLTYTGSQKYLNILLNSIG